MRTGTGAAAGRWGAAPALFGVGLLLASVAAGAGAAQPADPSGPTAQDLTAAIEEANRRVEQQRQAAGDAPATEAGTSAQELRATLDEVRRRVEQQRQATPAGDPAEELRAARGRVEGLARAMLDLRTERDALRAQLSQTRDGLAEAQQRQAAGERDRQAAAARAADLEKELAAATDRAGEADGLRAHAGELTAALAAARAETEGLKGRLDQTGRESAELRSVAAASVQEVRSLSDQLIAALAERSRLVAATEALSSSKALQDLQLAAHDDTPPAEAAPRQDPPAAPDPGRRRPKR